MTTVHVLILEAYLKKKSEANMLKRNLYIVENDISPKECPKCKTNNLHYYPDTNTWVCAYC